MSIDSGVKASAEGLQNGDIQTLDGLALETNGTNQTLILDNSNEIIANEVRAIPSEAMNIGESPPLPRKSSRRQSIDQI